MVKDYVVKGYEAQSEGIWRQYYRPVFKMHTVSGDCLLYMLLEQCAFQYGQKQY